MDKEVLHYILTSASYLYNNTIKQQELSDFLTKLIHDVNQMEVNLEQAKKIIDLAISSAMHFSHLQKAVT